MLPSHRAWTRVTAGVTDCPTYSHHTTTHHLLCYLPWMGFKLFAFLRIRTSEIFIYPSRKRRKKAKLVFRTSQNYFSKTKCFPYLYLAETIINRLPLNNFHLSKLLPVSQKYFLSLKIYWRCRCSGSRC